MRQLRKQILIMGGLAEQMIHEMSAVLLERKTELQSRIREREEEMDRLQKAIDDETLRLISVYTPVAGDLRLLLMTTRINGELERIGDQTLNIMKAFQILLEDQALKLTVDMPRMAELALSMVHDALDAFVERSEEQARAVIAKDDVVDALNDEISQRLLREMRSDPENVIQQLGLILVSRAFERIADHAVNIAEDTVYVLKGEDIRHQDA
jgi:phosphate transport system protein